MKKKVEEIIEKQEELDSKVSSALKMKRIVASDLSTRDLDRVLESTQYTMRLLNKGQDRDLDEVLIPRTRKPSSPR